MQETEPVRQTFQEQLAHLQEGLNFLIGSIERLEKRMDAVDKKPQGNSWIDRCCYVQGDDAMDNAIRELYRQCSAKMELFVLNEHARQSAGGITGWEC